jgi:hypothetical protein
LTILRDTKEAGPQFRKSEAAFRWWMKQPDFPLPIVRIGRRVYVTQESIDKFFADAMKDAS